MDSATLIETCNLGRGVGRKISVRNRVLTNKRLFRILYYLPVAYIQVSHELIGRCLEPVLSLPVEG